MNAEGTLIWTVSIKDRLEPEMDIWTATFSTEKKADDFIEKAKEKLRSYDALNTTDVIKDMTAISILRKWSNSTSARRVLAVQNAANMTMNAKLTRCFAKKRHRGRSIQPFLLPR